MENPLPDFGRRQRVSDSEVVSFNLLAGHDHGHAAFMPMMIGMMSVMVMGAREVHSSISSVNAFITNLTFCVKDDPK